MRTLTDIYDETERQNVRVHSFPLDGMEAMSAMSRKGRCGIAIDAADIKGRVDEKEKLAHELGHCATGSFYNIYATCDIRQKQENKADRWAYWFCVPFDELAAAIASGICTLWELAEYFDFSEQFIKRAIDYYTVTRGMRFNVEQTSLFDIA